MSERTRDASWVLLTLIIAQNSETKTDLTAVEHAQNYKPTKVGL